MNKLLRYVKPFIIPVLLCIVLLSGQAYCELTLPDFMQNIVNNGIQNGGIDSGIYKEIRESTLNAYLMFSDEEEKAIIENAYDLVTVDEATSSQVEEIPLLESENVYFLKEGLNDEDLNDLQDTITLLQMTFVKISQDAQETQTPLPMLVMQNGIDGYKEAAKEQMETLGASTVQSMTCQFVKQEYTELGMDMEDIQQSYITWNGIKMLGLAVMSALCAIAVGFLSARIGAGISRNLRNDTFEKITSFSFENFQKFSTSTLITRTTNDVQQVQMAIIMMIRIVIYAPIMGIGALVHVLTSGASMTWIIGLCIGIIMVLIIVVFIVVMPKFKLMQKFIDKMNGSVRELLDGMLVIRAFNNEEVEAEKFDKANTDITKTMLFTTRAMALLMPIMMFVMNGTVLLILWFGAKQVDAGVIQIGSIMAFMQYSMQVIMSFLMITMVSIMIPRANVSAVRINEVLETPITIKDGTKQVEFDTKKRGIVKFDHVSFHYPGSKEDVLTDIDFETKPGEVTAFVGSTGSGKSTLVNLVLRFYDVTKGSVEVDGVDVRDITQEKLRSIIGYVPQKGVLLSGTIESNLMYANHDANEDDLQEALRISQAKEFVDAKPKQTQEEIAQGGTNVSGGQKQRLSIARAIIRKPEIYIFDDSFSALDFKTDAKLREELMKSCKETQSTVLIVAQRISSILHADQIIVLDEGKMVGKGNHEELMQTCPVYQEIALSQLSKEELENAATK